MFLVRLFLCQFNIKNILLSRTVSETLSRIQFFVKFGSALNDNNQQIYRGFILDMVGFFEGINIWGLIADVIIPVITVILAYRLTESANRRKESNRLSIELYWVRKEIEENKAQFKKFIVDYREKERAEEVLKYPFALYHDLLIHVMEKIDKICQEHPVRGDILLCSAHSIEFGKLLNKYEMNERAILELEEEFKDYPEIPEQKKKELEELRIERAGLKREIEYRNEPGDSIFEKLDELYYYLEKQKIGEDIPAIEDESDTAKCLNYFRSVLKKYMKKRSHTSLGAASVVKKMIVYSSHINVFEDVSVLDDFYRDRRENLLEKCNALEKTVIKMYENYVLRKRLISEITDLEFYISDAKWKKFQDDLVLINDRKLYFEINALYDQMINTSKDIKEVELVMLHIEKVLDKFRKLERRLEGKRRIK